MTCFLFSNKDSKMSKVRFMLNSIYPVLYLRNHFDQFAAWYLSRVSKNLKTWQNDDGVIFSIFVSVLPYKKLTAANHGFPIIALIIRLKLIEYSVHTFFTFRFGSISKAQSMLVFLFDDIAQFLGVFSHIGFGSGGSTDLSVWDSPRFSFLHFKSWASSESWILVRGSLPDERVSLPFFLH